MEKPIRVLLVEELDRIKQNQRSELEDETQEGSELTFEDTAQEQMEVVVGGNTKQQTYDGKNLFDKTKATEGVINRNTGNKDSTNVYTSSDYIKVKPNTNYKLNIVLFLSDEYGFAFYDANKTYISGMLATNSITTPATAEYFRFCFRNSNWTGGYSTITDINTIMLVEGTILPTSYEPYVGGTASPNLSYPQAIKNATGTQNIKIQNGNWFDFERWLNGLQALNSPIYDNRGTINEITKSSLTITSTEEDCYTNTLDFLSVEDLKFNVKENTNYTIRFKKKNGVSGRMYIFFWDENNKKIADVFSTLDNTLLNFLVPSKTKFATLRFGIQHSGYNETFSEVMLVEGTYTSTTMPVYKPYQEQNLPFTLQEGQKLMEGDYLADDGIHHKRGQYIFTGNEYINKNDSNNNENSLFWTRAFSFAKENLDSSLCNYLSYKSIHKLDALNEEGFRLTINPILNNVIYLNIKTTENTPTSIKTWLKEKYESGEPLVIEYNLIEEIIEPYTPEQKKAYKKIKELQSYYGQTNITAIIDNLPVTLKVTAKKSNKIRIKKLEQALLAQGAGV